MTSEKVKKFLDGIKKDLGFLPEDLHITRKACAFVAISNGRVIKIETPRVCRCPLFTTLFSYDNINKESIESKFKWQSENWGMFTCSRKVCDEKIIVPFGASEMIMYSLKKKRTDAAVVACEGAGTVITTNPEVVQGIGAYMNGLFYTTPIREVISRIEDTGATVLSPSDAAIDQFEGVKKALKLGYSRIAVTVRGDEQDTIKKIRKLEKEMKNGINKKSKKKGPIGKEAINAVTEEIAKTGRDDTEWACKKGINIDKINQDSFDNKVVNIVILTVCNTGISKEQAVLIRDKSDLAWGCASKFIREIVGPESILQIGIKIPVFVITSQGLDFISSYSTDKFLKEKLKDIARKHYITSNKFDEGAVKINMGKFSVFLYETKKLPVLTKDEPYPLI